MMNDSEIMRIALEEARASAEAGEVPIGAVLVYREEVLARGGNRTIRDCDPTAHAEIVVLREAAKKLGNYRLAETTLYVTLEPCAMCAGAIVQARVPRLVYAADDQKAERSAPVSNCSPVPNSTTRSRSPQPCSPPKPLPFSNLFLPPAARFPDRP